MNEPSQPQILPMFRDAAQSERALYGLMAYCSLSAFERLSSDARFAPALGDRAELGRLSVTEYEHFVHARRALSERGEEFEASLEPFMRLLDDLHERTRPGDWYESLMKAYVLDTLTSDLYAELAQGLPEASRQRALEIGSMEEQTQWLAARLSRAIAEHELLGPRLALWGRRVMGEAVIQARQLLQRPEFDVAPEVRAELTAHLTRRHSQRMSALGLTA